MKNKAFTIAETIVTLAIIALISVAVGKFAGDIFFFGNTARDSLSVSQDARNLLRLMTREIRAAAPSSNGAYPLVTVASSTISFFSDVDGNGERDFVRYYLSSTTLMKEVMPPLGATTTYTMMSDVQNTNIFTYFDNGYATTSSIQLVRLVKIDLLLDQKIFTTQVSIRNLKDNL